MKRLVLWNLLLPCLLVACNLEEWAPVEQAPSPTASPTREALATSTIAVTFTPALPSATPDPVLLPERFTSPTALVTFRYPSGWSVTDNSDENEILVLVQSPVGDERPGFFLLNLLSAGDALTREGLAELAESYVGNFFEGREIIGEASYREEGDSLIATRFTEENGERLQFELRFAPRPPYYQVLILVAAADHWSTAAPLLDSMARSVVVQPEAAGLPTPAPSSVRQSQGLSVKNSSLYLAPTGSLYLVGEVWNESGQPYEEVEVAATLVDGAGNELASERWAIQRRLLLPGERSPLLIIFGTAPSGWTDARVAVDGLPASRYLEQITTDFETSEVAASQPALGAYALEGTLTNTGQDARSVELIGTLYDAEGRVLAVEMLEQDMLSAGERVPFALTFYSKAEGEVARYELLVEGVRASSR